VQLYKLSATLNLPTGTVSVHIHNSADASGRPRPVQPISNARGLSGPRPRLALTAASIRQPKTVVTSSYKEPRSGAAETSAFSKGLQASAFLHLVRTKSTTARASASPTGQYVSSVECL